jgi:hypothetical protein
VTRLTVALVLAALTCVSCVSYVKGAASTAATGVVATVTDDQSKKELDALAASVVGTARDQALGPVTQAQMAVLVRAVVLQLQAQLQIAVKALGSELRGELASALDGQFKDQLAQLREALLGADTRQLLAQLLAEIVDAAPQLREQLVGAPLRQDADALIADVGPRIDASVQTSLAAARADAAADLSKYKWLLGVSCVLLVVVVFAAAYIDRGRRKVIVALRAHRS